MSKITKPLKVGQTIPVHQRAYPHVADQQIARVHWNWNGTNYYALYVNRDAVALGSCAGKSIKAVCTNAEQVAACTEWIRILREWHRTQRLRQMIREYDGHSAWKRRTKQEQQEFLAAKRAGTLPTRAYI